ncbi:MAG: hypothetical protein WCH37_10015, partial [Synechococcaceae cyanobacterium ELA182]
DILAAFKTYYATAELAEVTDPNLILDLKTKLDAQGHYDDFEIERVVKVLLDDLHTGKARRTRSGVETINQTIAPRSTPHGEGDLISGLCWRAQGIGSKEGITPRR